jgi:uncharacterized membrane protein YozB (DUF420 family)
MRRFNFGGLLPSAVAISTGLITLLGLLGGAGLGLFSDLISAPIFGISLRVVADILIQLAVITGALTVIIGVTNLIVIHLGRVAGRKRGLLDSLVLVLSFVLVIGVVVFERLNPPAADVTPLSQILFQTVLLSIESALAGLLLFGLVLGAYRLLQRRVTWHGLVFLAAMLLVLLGELARRGAIPLPELSAALNQLSGWLAAVPVNAGARGLLLGMALATAVAAVRVLIGQDRSYRE